jgi:hypothetical protein
MIRYTQIERETEKQAEIELYKFVDNDPHLSKMLDVYLAAMEKALKREGTRQVGKAQCAMILYAMITKGYYTVKARPTSGA